MHKRITWWLVCGLVVKMLAKTPTSHIWVSNIQMLGSGLWFQFPSNTYPWEAVGDGLSIWVPATYLGDMNWVSDSWFWLQYSPAVVDIWGVNQYMGTLFVSVSVSLCLSLELIFKKEEWHKQGMKTEKWILTYAKYYLLAIYPININWICTL